MDRDLINILLGILAAIAMGFIWFLWLRAKGF